VYKKSKYEVTLNGDSMTLVHVARRGSQGSRKAPGWSYITLTKSVQNVRKRFFVRLRKGIFCAENDRLMYLLVFDNLEYSVNVFVRSNTGIVGFESNSRH
jgi:hypothetical protein